MRGSAQVGLGFDFECYKRMEATNTLAYYVTESIAAVKVFIAQAPSRLLIDESDKMLRIQIRAIKFHKKSNRNKFKRIKNRF
jgi:hypothetical protein